MKWLFLDDVRMPYEVGNYIYPVEERAKYRKENWEIVRNFDEFRQWILDNGLPDVVSFDHDLAVATYDIKTRKETFHFLPETGYDCARWMVDFCVIEKYPLPQWFVHSQNPAGAENIKRYLENAKKHLNL